MRKTIYKAIIEQVDPAGKAYAEPITVATTDISKIPGLIEKNRFFFTSATRKYTRMLEIKDTLYTMNMSDEQYADAMMFVDIIDDLGGDWVGVK